MSEKNNKIVFTENIDKRINSFALIIAFIGIGLFLLFEPNYFGNEIVGKAVQGLFIVVGFFGLCSEVSRNNSSSKIKGYGNLLLGLFFIAIWLALYFVFKHWVGNLIGFFALVFGAYGSCLGLLQIVYSIWNNKQTKEMSFGSILSDLIFFLTKISSLVLLFIQIIKAFQGL